ncbi:MAG: hypothetical protein ACM31E_02215 [Fibrobacterota bacterium]|nr:hypothetical protein [Chitinispirillaceae bacterium]
MADTQSVSTTSTTTPIDATIIETTTKPVSSYKTIGERLQFYSIVITNTSDQAIFDALGKFNYTPEKIARGKLLIENAYQADAVNAKEYGEQYAATQRVETEFKEASVPYMTSLGVARIAFKNDIEAAKALALKGKRASSIANWLRDAELFYRNILTNDRYLNAMAEFGRTRQMLEAEYKEVLDVKDAFAQQKKEIGEALESTMIRDTRMEELDAWMSDFIGIARIALQSNPEYLTKLGL